MRSGRLVSKGYTRAEKALAGNFVAGDVVAFHRPYRRMGVGKGDERRVAGVDHKARTVQFDDGKGGTVDEKLSETVGRRGGREVFRGEGIELCVGDRIRWTRNDAGLELVNNRTDEVLSVANGRVTFRLEGGQKFELGTCDPQLRHLGHAWASTVHAFQDRPRSAGRAAGQRQAGVNSAALGPPDRDATWVPHGREDAIRSEPALARPAAAQPEADSCAPWTSRCARPRQNRRA